MFETVDALLRWVFPAMSEEELGQIFWLKSSKIEVIDASNSCLHSVVSLLDATGQETAEKHLQNEADSRAE